MAASMGEVILRPGWAGVPEVPSPAADAVWAAPFLHRSPPPSLPPLHCPRRSRPLQPRPHRRRRRWPTLRLAPLRPVPLRRLPARHSRPTRPRAPRGTAKQFRALRAFHPPRVPPRFRLGVGPRWPSRPKRRSAPRIRRAHRRAHAAGPGPLVVVVARCVLHRQPAGWRSSVASRVRLRARVRQGPPDSAVARRRPA